MEIYLLHHSHTDFGYTHYPETVFALQREYLRQAMYLAEKYADGNPGEQFKWTIETLATLEDFLKTAKPAEVDHLLELHRQGLIDVSGLYGNWFPLADVQILQETFEVLERIRRDYGFRVDYGLNCDVTGQSWGLVELMLDYGFKGFGMAMNRTMARDPQPRPRGFWWQAPSGRKLLTWHGEHYGLGQHFGIPRVKTSAGWVIDLDASRKKLGDYVKTLEKSGHPYDFTLFQITSTFLYDNGPPHEDLVVFVREWNKRGWEPRLKLVNLEEFFGRIATLPDLPALSGDWTDWWTQGVGSSLAETILNRQNHARFFAVRGLASLLNLQSDSCQMNSEEDEKTWRCLALFDEHTWGSAESVTHPWSPHTKAALNWKYRLAYEGDAKISYQARLSMRALSARLLQSEAAHAVIYNPLPWARTVSLYLPQLYSTSWALANLENSMGLSAPHSSTTLHCDYGMIDLPACGYRVIPLRLSGPISAASRFDLAEMASVKPPDLIPRIAPGMASSTLVVDRDGELANPFYRLRFDSQTGAIISLTCLGGGAEWVDQSTPWRLGQYVYETNRSPRGRADMQVTMESLPDFDRQPLLQPVRQPAYQVSERYFVPGVSKGRVVQRLSVPGVRELWMQVVLYDDQPWIDLIYDLFKTEVLEPESVYITFPFAFYQPVAHYDTSAAIVQAETEQLPFANRDFYHVQSWVDLTDKQRGITLVTPDAPLVHLGGFTNHRYQDALKMEQPCLVSWLMNNHWMTAFPVSQSGWVRCRYRLIPHTSVFDPVAAVRSAAEMIYSPLVGPLWDRPPGMLERTASGIPDLPESTSFLEVQPASVNLVGLKPGEMPGELVLTLQELKGEASEYRIQFQHNRFLRAAYREVGALAQWRSLSIRENSIIGQIAPNRLQTIRIDFIQE